MYRMHYAVVGGLLFVKTWSFFPWVQRVLCGVGCKNHHMAIPLHLPPHKLHFHCDSSACPAWQPIATLAINLVSENAVHLFGAEGIGTLMKWLLLKKESQNNATAHFQDHAVLLQRFNALTWEKGRWWLFGLKCISNNIITVVSPLRFRDNDKRRALIRRAVRAVINVARRRKSNCMQISTCKRITWIHHSICQECLQPIRNR